jgi:hypothetical protein
MKVGEKESFAYLNNKQVFPTPIVRGKSRKTGRRVETLTAVTNHEQFNLHIIGIVATSHCDESRGRLETNEQTSDAKTRFDFQFAG